MRRWLLARLGARACGKCGCLVSRKDEEAHAKFHRDVHKGRMSGAVYG